MILLFFFYFCDYLRDSILLINANCVSPECRRVKKEMKTEISRIYLDLVAIHRYRKDVSLPQSFIH